MDYAWVCADSFELVCDLNEVHETNKICVVFCLILS